MTIATVAKCYGLSNREVLSLLDDPSFYFAVYNGKPWRKKRYPPRAIHMTPEAVRRHNAELKEKREEEDQRIQREREEKMRSPWR